MLHSFDGASHLSHDKSHGRLETRCALINKDLSVLGDLEFDWPALKTMGIMINIRQENKHATEADVSLRFYISSKDLSAKELLDSTRAHWLEVSKRSGCRRNAIAPLLKLSARDDGSCSLI